MFPGPKLGSSGASSSGWERRGTIQLIFLGHLLDALVQVVCVSCEGELQGAELPVPKARPVRAERSNTGEGRRGVHLI